MSTDEIDRNLALVRLLTYNIVQIRGLCKRVFEESKNESNFETLQKVLFYVDASFQKTVADEKNIKHIFSMLEDKLNEMQGVEKTHYLQIIELNKKDVDEKLQESVFTYKEE